MKPRRGRAGSKASFWRSVAAASFFCSSGPCEIGYDVVSPFAGEFLQYSVDLPTTGTYDFSIRLANGRANLKYHVEIDGVNKSGTIAVPITNASTPTYQTLTPFSTALSAGKHRVKIVWETTPSSGTGSPPRFNSFSLTPLITPQASVATARTITAPAAFTQFAVTYRDNGAINVSTIDSLDVRVKTVDGFNAPAELVSVSESNGASLVTAVYRVAAAGTAWDPADNDVYMIDLQPGQIADTTGLTATAQTIGTFHVDIKPFAVRSNFPQPGSTLIVNGGEGNDVLGFSRVGETISAFSRNVILGTASTTSVTRLLVNAGGGNDVITAAPLDIPVAIDGGAGNDTMTGGSAADELLGGLGADQAINPHIGPDRVDLGDETSATQGVRFSGTDKNDVIVVRRELRAGKPFMIFQTNRGRFSFPVTGCRTVFVNGLGGDDLILMHASAASNWRARFAGGSGNDTLVGGALSDSLFGQNGDDKLIGQAAADLLVGGAGTDRLIF